jgi:hypothetical protein
VADQWQRVESVEELYEKVQDVDKMFPAIEDYYVRNTMKSKESYYEQFEKRMNEILNGV